VKVPGVIDNNPIAHEESDTESEESDTENENPDYDIVVEPNKQQQEIMNIANKNKIMEDEDRSDRMSVYSRLVIGIAINKKDDETDNTKTAATTTLSQYSMFLRNKNISTPNTQSATEVDKTEKTAVSEFYDDSYYMAIHYKTSYYPADESNIYAHGFNDYVFKFTVRKKSRIVEYSIYKQVNEKKLPRFKVVYNMDGSVHTILEVAKELGYKFKDCFEDKMGMIFVLTGEEMLADVNKDAPALHFEYNVNKYNDVLSILEGYGNRKNVKYRMHLTEGTEQIYSRQTVTDEENIKINCPDNAYRAVRYGLDGNGCNYIVMEIKIPNTNGFTYRFMNIFEIIDQYRVKPRESEDDEELDSRAEDMENIVLDGAIAKKRQHNSDTDSYASIKTTRDFYSKKDDD
jgi:hypothetical protein